MGNCEMLNVFLVEKQDGGLAVLSAPNGAGSEGNLVVFDSGKGEELGVIRIRITELAASPFIKMLSALTVIFPVKHIYGLKWSREENNA